MTTDLMNLAENYARLCYEGDAGPLVINARQALLDALEVQRREIEWLKASELSAHNIRLMENNTYLASRHDEAVGKLRLAEAERDTLRAELAAIRAQEPVARVDGYYGGRCVVSPLNRAAVLPTGMALYAAPAASPDACLMLAFALPKTSWNRGV